MKAFTLEFKLSGRYWLSVVVVVVGSSPRHATWLLFPLDWILVFGGYTKSRRAMYKLSHEGELKEDFSEDGLIPTHML